MKREEHKSLDVIYPTGIIVYVSGKRYPESGSSLVIFGSFLLGDTHQ
jgi:hypothetical protein